MKIKIVKSPIFYMGNKERLIKKGLLDLFPKNIDTFYEIFCGSAICSLNVSSNNICINDIDMNVIEMINYFKLQKPYYVVNKIEHLINYYEMPTFSTDARVYKGDRNIYKERYNKIRNDYNKTHNVELLYLLNIFSNSHMIRFNKNNEFNMPFGNGYFTNQCKENILNNTYNKINCVLNKDFRYFINHNFKKDDFIYLDPPYLNTTATYNENNKWDLYDEIELLKWCEQLNSKNIKFGISNIFSNKDYINTNLIDWCKNNNFYVYHFNNFSYCACGKGNSKTDEVFITNYQIL